MAVRVQSNNLPIPAVRAAVQEAVLGAIGEPSGDWQVQIHEGPYSPAWQITIWGPNDFQWTREFFGPEQQNSLDGYAVIKRTVSNLFLVPMAYVERLQLADFRCFDQLDLRFDRQSSLEGRWTCIAGINGAGKSSVLQALSLALLGNTLAIELGGERLNRMRRLVDLFNRKRATIEVILRSTEPGPEIDLPLVIDEGRIVGPGSLYGGVPSWERVRQLVVAGYGATRNLSPRIDASSEHLSSDVRRHITLFEPLSQLAGAEVLLAQQRPKGPFAKLFENVLRQVLGAELQIMMSAPGMRFMVSERDVVEAVDLPDGFRSAAAWIADLCAIWCEKFPWLASAGNPSDIQAIVLIDEIDLHLHPSLQRSLVPRLRKVLPKVQWVVTTHSPLVLANFDVNEIIALDRDVDGSVRQLDRQILGFSSDQIYEWLMGTEPTGEAIEDVLGKNEARGEPTDDEVAELLETSPTVSEPEARQRMLRLKGAIERLKP